MWKTFESHGEPTGAVADGRRTVRRDSHGARMAMRACSACASDYEDPDRTAKVDEDIADDLEVEELNERDEGELKEGEDGRDFLA